ncbi:MAG: hypothetical protein GW878_01285 [Acidobacteria bacterium]|nr:hypothetical protein [Acidobacteriota bacterium]
MTRRPNLAASPFPNLRPLMLGTGLLAVLALALSTFTLLDAMQARGSERGLEAKLVELKARRLELARRVDDSSRRLAAVKWKQLDAETASFGSLVARRNFAWSVLLGDLERVIPWDVRLTGITPVVQEDGSLKVGLQGIATTREAWLKLIARLFADERFSDPVPVSEEAPGTGSPMGTTFSVVARYWPEGRR